ncbi:hypothetical protein DFQ28_008837 [Apophysomyces sp. BC1034]|nr:hypothetical protein DFQ29_004907 [Apophysomyces sp. BC1021]KAG0185745.1 hypothetical protein DFQ28_008837 [Apophysomyces sp. BC1034]
MQQNAYYANPLQRLKRSPQIFKHKSRSMENKAKEASKTEVQPGPMLSTNGLAIRSIRTRLAAAVAEAPRPGMASTK